jgi:hypothetical protein
MVSKTLANPNQIVKLNVRYKEKSDYFYIDRIPEKRIFFGLIKTEDEVPAGWFKYAGLLYGRLKTKPLKEVLRNPTLYFDKDAIWKKPYIDVIYSNGKNDTMYFKTGDELDVFVYELKTKYSLDFVVIYKDEDISK